MPNAKRKRKTKKVGEPSWKTRTKKVDFTGNEQDEINAWLQERELEPLSSFIEIVDSGYSLKSRFSEHYDNYTITLGCSDDHMHYPKHNFWFVYDDLPTGILICHFVAQMWLDNGHLTYDEPERTTGWVK